MKDSNDGSARLDSDPAHSSSIHTQRNTELARAAERCARGEFEPAELLQLRAHVDACLVCRELLDEHTRLDSTLASCLTPIEPRAELWDQVAARTSGAPSLQPWKSWTDDRSRVDANSGLVFVTGDQRAFEPTGRPGISTRRLSVDRANRRVSMLVHMAAGASYPAHRHGGPEECYVVSGDLYVGSPGSTPDAVHMAAGDFQRAEAGSVHPVQYTDGGCLLLITSSLDDELLGV